MLSIISSHRLLRVLSIQRPGTGCLACDARRMSEWWAARAHSGTGTGHPPPILASLLIDMDKLPSRLSHAIARSGNGHKRTEKVSLLSCGHVECTINRWARWQDLHCSKAGSSKSFSSAHLLVAQRSSMTKVPVTKCRTAPLNQGTRIKPRSGGSFRSCPLTPVEVIAWQLRRAIGLTLTRPGPVPRHHQS
jgi:hypothetical protein